MSTEFNALQRKDVASLMHGYANLVEHARQGPRIFSRGFGVYLQDDSGRQFLDATASMGCANFGFSERELVVAASMQLRRLPCYHTLGSHAAETAIQLASRLADIVPIEDAHVFFAQSGSEANEFLIKFLWYYQNAIGKPEKKKVIVRTNAEHGATLAACSMTGLAAHHASFDLPLPGFVRSEEPDFRAQGRDGESETGYLDRLLADFEALILEEGAETIMACMIEPCSISAVQPPHGYYEGLQALLEKHDILLLADERQTAFGRTGDMFGSECFGLMPAAMTLGESLAGGFQAIAAVVLRGDIYQAIAEHSAEHGNFAHASNQAGLPVSAAVALRALDLMEERSILAHVAGVMPLFHARLAKLGQRGVVADARAIGLLAAVQLAETLPWEGGAAELARVAENFGLLLRVVPIGECIGLSPPLTITKSELYELFDRFEMALDKLCD